MKNLPARRHPDKTLTVSADGSFTFYSHTYKETYRVKSAGAFTESFHKFVNASGVLKTAMTKDVRILDLCFGLGYNCAVTLQYLSNTDSTHKVHIVSVEKDTALAPLVAGLEFMWPPAGYRILRECLKNGRSGRFSMELWHRDAQKFLYEISGKFDVIYFDPFSRTKNPEMWTSEIFIRLRELMEGGGVLVTYASGKAPRTAMREAGFEVHEVQTIREAFQPSTRAIPY